MYMRFWVEGWLKSQTVKILGLETIPSSASFCWPLNAYSSAGLLIPSLSSSKLSYSEVAAVSTVDTVELETATVVIVDAAATNFLLLSAFTTGKSKKVARRHTMDNGKYTFLTFLGFSWLLERHKS